MSGENTNKQTAKAAKQLKIDDGVSVKVKSGFYGVLYYRNPRTQESFIWEHVGDVQFLSMSDLKTIKAQNAGYFKNQWLVIVGVADDSDCKASAADICKALAIDIYYKNFIDPTKFEDACAWNDEEIRERVAMLSEGAKQNLIVALNGFISDGTLDSRKKIKAFEKALGCELQNNQ